MAYLSSFLTLNSRKMHQINIKIKFITCLINFLKKYSLKYKFSLLNYIIKIYLLKINNFIFI